jgi:signal transduction histidine kinase
MPTLTFTVDSALLAELGEKLVESAHVALVELVKNSYDADATKVMVRFTPQPRGGPDIEISDNGAGMTYDEVQQYWMRIATTHKRKNNISPKYGRPRTGEKGIGRFSCRRLGEKLRLTSVAVLDKHRFQHTEVIFNWRDFVPGTEITTIECEGETKIVASGRTGTTLRISGSPIDEWSGHGYGFLKRQFAILVANRGARRQGFQVDPGFNLTLEAPNFHERIENLRDRLLSAGWGDITIEVDNKGNAECALRAMRIGTKTVKYPRKVPMLSGVTAKIGIMEARDRSEMRDRRIISKGTLGAILDQWGGVFIKYKGFRVFPYGEPNTDWLNIEHDRATRKTALPDMLQPFAAKLRGVNPGRALLALLSEKSYIGDVEIDERARGFEMKASREGFIGEMAIAPLRHLIRFAIDWATMYREYYKSLVAKEESDLAREELALKLRKAVSSSEVVTAAVRAVESEVKSFANQLATTERQQVLRSVRTATEAIERHEESSQEELRHLRLVASTSTLLLIFSHEVKSLLTWLEEVSITLKRVGRSVPKKESDRLTEIENEFTSVKQRFLDLLSMTSLLSVKDPEAKVEKLTLKPRVDKAVRCFNLIKRTYDIEIDTDSVSPTLQVGPISEAELYAVLLNVLSNAIKSVIAKGAPRKIAMSAERDGRVSNIHVRDSGVGIPDSHYDDVFAPFVADPTKRLYRALKAKLNPEDEYIVGTGSGLGLSIVKEILSYRGGDVRFVAPTENWKADLAINLP